MTVIFIYIYLRLLFYIHNYSIVVPPIKEYNTTIN
nr:MAG TPA: hypothetical protein [Caudoviricetes sp.]